MKISDNTIGILRNFSDINANILFKPGKIDNNDGDPYSVSSPENVLKYLQSTSIASNSI